MGRASDAGPRDRWAVGQSFAKGMRRTGRWWLAGSAAIILLMGTWFFGRAYSLAETRGEVGQNVGEGHAEATDGTWFGSNSPWTVQRSNDPMTDATVHQAAATFEGAQYDIEVAVVCGSAGEISYTATSFDKEGYAPQRHPRDRELHLHQSLCGAEPHQLLGQDQGREFSGSFISDGKAPDIQEF